MCVPKKVEISLRTNIFSTNQNLLMGILAIIITGLYLIVVKTASPVFISNHYNDLAYAFLHGHLHLIPPIGDYYDYAAFQNNYYVYFGPFPALILLPFVAVFGRDFPQIFLSYLSSIVAFFTLYRISREINVDRKSDAWWFAIFFIFGSIFAFLALSNVTAYLVQIVGTTFLIVALYQFFKKRIRLSGLFIACAGMTRPTLYLATIFFLIEIVKSRHEKWRELFKLLLPISISIVLLAGYNAVRFGNPFETGYSYIPNRNPIYTAARAYGEFSLMYIPGNLYFLLFKGPDPVRADNLTYILKFPYLRVNEWGLGIFFTSPLFLYLFSVNVREKFVISSLITTLCMLFVVLTYYNSGLWQYGYRYALDFYPLLFIILVSVFKYGLPLRAKGLICYSIVFNLCYMFSILNTYPFWLKL